MDAFFSFLGDFVLVVPAFLDMVGMVGGILFFAFLLWLTTSRKASAFLSWLIDSYFDSEDAESDGA